MAPAAKTRQLNYLNSAAKKQDESVKKGGNETQDAEQNDQGHGIEGSSLARQKLEQKTKDILEKRRKADETTKEYEQALQEITAKLNFEETKEQVPDEAPLFTPPKKQKTV